MPLLNIQLQTTLTYKLSLTAYQPAMAVRMAATAMAKPAFCPFGQIICLVHQHIVCFAPTIPSPMLGRKVLQLKSVVSLRRTQNDFSQISGHQ